MKNSVTNVVSLHQLQKEFEETQAASITEHFAGFSQRMNELIDLTDIDIPAMHDGRQAYLSSLLQSSKMSSADWLKKNRPPKASTLRNIVVYLLNHIPGSYNPLRVEAWLKYGDEAVPNPFEARLDNQSLIPLAAALIASEAKTLAIPPAAFDLNNVLSCTVDMLADFHITNESMVEAAHRQIIAQHIKLHPKA